MVFSNPLLLLNHSDSPFRANEGADAAAFAVVVIDFDVSRHFIPCNAEVRTKVPAKITASAEVINKTAACLFDGRLLIETRFSVTGLIRSLLWLPAS